MFEITPADAGDIAVTAAEGGIGYWSQIAEYRPSRWLDNDTGDTRPGFAHPHGDEFIFYSLTDLDGVYYDVNVAAIKRGWRYLCERWQNHTAPYGFDPRDEAGYADSDAADMIVQFGLYGEVRYG